ncbi:MAG: hypothetical protein ACREJ2_13925, partial [Planctomycetota bacterium]
PWGDPAIGPAHFAAAWAILAAAASAVLIGMARRGLAQAAEANAAERFVDRVAWVIWPLILFDMVYERNLRMVGFSAQGIPFDFMHWGEWWAPWEALQHGGRLWVNVFPIHGVGNDIGPCSMAAWLGDASLSGRFQVDAVLNAVMFVLFYWGLLKISRLRSVALLGVLMIVWEEPSWFKTWLADSRYLMLFAWALAALAVGDRLSRAAAGSSRGATGLRAAALLLGLLPLVCFLDSVDVGYVTLVATAGLAALLILWPARFSAEAALARGAGWIAAAALLGSCGVFLVGLGDRLPTFWAYHWAVFRDKGWFDFLPLGFSDAYSAVKVLYIVATPVAVGGTVLAVLRGAGSGAAPASDPTVSEGRWAFGPLAVAGAAFLYFKKGLDRTDTAHFEQAAILTPLLVAYLLAVLQRRCCFRRAESGGAIRESGNLAVSSVGALVGAPGALASAPGSWTGAPGAPAGLALALGAGLLCWVGITQQVVSLASHPARPQIWGLVEPHPKTNLPDCPRAGTLRCIGEQAEPVDATLAWLRSNTAPGEPVYDFTNSNLWSFLADRPNPTRFAQSFHALDDGFQREAVADLKRHPPVAVLFPSGPTGVDHVDLTLRQHWISAWLLQHYAPALHVGYYLVLLPIDPAWRSVRYRPPPPGFSAEDFLGEQDQGFVPRAFAAAPPVALGPPQETVAPGGSTAAAEPLRLYGLTPDGDLAQAWRFQTTEPRARVILPLPRPIDPRTAGWLDLDLSVSAGTYAAVDFLTAAQVAALDPHTPPEALHRVDFRLIPARHTGLVTTYRFHLAALPNWMFRRDPIVALDLTPTDESYIQVHIAAVRFYPDASLAPPAAPGESAP